MSAVTQVELWIIRGAWQHSEHMYILNVFHQIENEYGSYVACDMDYMIRLRDIVSSIVGDAAVLYTTDGAASSFLRCGKVDSVYATVDFGTSKKLFCGLCAAGWHPRPLHSALQHNRK
jgi:hypothetical protein